MNLLGPPRPRRSLLGIGLGLVLGLLAGFAGAWLFLQWTPREAPDPIAKVGWPAPDPTDPAPTLMDSITEVPEAGAVALYSPDAEQPAEAGPATPAEAPVGTRRPVTPPQPLQGVIPLSPFGLGTGVSPVDGPMLGQLPGIGPPSPVIQPVGASLETVVMEREVFDVVQSRMGSFARDAGGSARAFVDYRAGQPQQSRGLLIAVPDDRLEEAFLELVQAGSIVNRDSWRGSASARRTRLAGDLLDQRDLLEKRRQELLVRWLEDAEPVRRVDEELAEVRRSLAEVELGRETDSKAVIRITFR